MSEEIVTINVIEASENVVINVYEGKEQTDWNQDNSEALSYLKNKPNAPNADTVTNDTEPAATDRVYFFRALTGWFYLTWARMVYYLSEIFAPKSHTTTEANAHPASAISHKDSTVAERLDNITEGSISRDGNNNITSITTFGEATVINRDVDGIITGWENDTHEWTLTKTGDTITGWAVAEKP